MGKKLWIIIFSCAVSAFAKAQTVRPYSNEFLNIGVDAAALGQASAVVAQTDDVNSGYWNPSGLLQMEDRSLSLMHASYFANIAQYNYAAYAQPVDSVSAVGFSVIRFGVDDILNTTQLIDDQGNVNYDRISRFSATDWAFTASYARALRGTDITLGGNFKVIRRLIGDFADSWGFGLDVGAQYRTGAWSFGVMARDITTTYNTWAINEERYEDISGAVEGENQELPETTEITLPKLQIGIARDFRFNYDLMLRAEADMNLRFTQTNDVISSEAVSATPAVGFSFSYDQLAFIRAGVGNFQNVAQLEGGEQLGFQPNIGLGFKYKGIGVDYALTDIGDQSAALYSNIFSVNVDFSVFR